MSKTITLFGRRAYKPHKETIKMSKLSLKKTYPTKPTLSQALPYKFDSCPTGKNLIYTSNRHVIIQNIDQIEKSHIFSEHKYDVEVAKMSPSGALVASADKVGNIMIWKNNQESSGTGNSSKEILATHRFGQKVYHFDWSYDSNFLLICGSETLLLNIQENKCLQFEALFAPVTAGAICPKPLSNGDLTIILCAGAGQNERITYTANTTGIEFRNKQKMSVRFNDIKFNSAGTKFAIAATTGEIFVYDYNGMPSESQNERKIANAHNSSCCAISWSPNKTDNEKLVSCSTDKTVKIWEVQNLKEVACHKFSEGLSDMQQGVVWNKSGMIVSISLSGDINYLENFDDQNQNSNQKTIVKVLNPSDDRKKLMDAKIDQNQNKLHPDLLKILQNKNFSEKTSVATNNNGLIIISGQYKNHSTGDQGFTKIFRNVDGKLIENIEESKNLQKMINGGATSLKFNHKGDILAVGEMQEKCVRLFEITEGNGIKQKSHIYAHSSQILNLSWSNDDKFLVSSELQGKICIWNTLAGKKKTVVDQSHRNSKVTGFSWSGERSFYTFGSDGLVKEWEVAEGF